MEPEMMNTKHRNLLPLWLSLSLWYCHASYSPADLILLDCGSSGTQVTNDGRRWTGEVGSKFAPSEAQVHDRSSGGNKSQALGAASQEPGVERVPYLSARLSRSSFTYTFPMATGGPKFVRLYFYPASYSSGGSSFEPSGAFFSVKSGPYTLLNNFSALFTAQELDRASVYREFSVYVEEAHQKLILTFAPSVWSYAFINGIEIVSMPTNLYYAPPPGVSCIKILDRSSGSVVNCTLHKGTALETVYRLNVGGRSIPPSKDYGLFRSWSTDDDFTTGLTFVPVLPDVKINYTKVPNYTAPQEVYSTSQSMGHDNAWNEKNNLTWRLPLDGGFSYMVRLHFCDYQLSAPGERPFYIYIDNKTAEDYADVVTWSGGNSVPVYRDYLLTLKKENNKTDGKYPVFIALHPKILPDAYTNVLLNGIEMFKLNDTGGNLAGPNPNPKVTPSGNTPSRPPVNPKKKSKKTVIVVAVSAGCGCALFGLLIIAFFLLRRRRTKGTTSLENKDGSSLLPETLCRRFSFEEIRIATNNFDESLCVGRGAFGKVYKGLIDGGETVAIKQLGMRSTQGAREFVTEIQTLSQLRHRHLVSLIGYCDQGRQKILVYEFMTNGTLEDHLYKKAPLPWNLRLNICIGAARGLHHLHAEAPRTIVHRDVKPANILLDKDWVAKVADFGLSKVGPASLPNTKFETARLTGTAGYYDPEYFQCAHLTEKSDVYSFGVILLEVLCGRKAVKDEVHLPDWVETCRQDGTLDQIVDPHLGGKIGRACFDKFVDVAQRCLRESGINRPTMRDVVSGLEEASRLQKEGEVMSKEDADDLKVSQENFGDKAAGLDVCSGVSDSATSGWTSTGITSGSHFGSESATSMTSGDTMLVKEAEGR